MFSKLIRTSVPANFIFIPIIIITGWWSTFNNASLISWNINNSIFLSLLPENFLLIKGIGVISILILVIISLLLISFTTKYFHGIMGNVLPAVIFLLFSSQLSWVTSQGASLISVVIFLFVIRNLFHVYHQNKVFNYVFNAGFLAGLAVLTYSPSVLLLFACWVTVILLRKFDFREFLTVLLGFLLPLIFTHALFLLLGKEQNIYKIIEQNIKIISFEFVNYKQFIWLIFFAVLILWSVVKVSISGILKKIAIRRYFYSFLFIIVISTLFLSIYDDKGVLAFMLIPASYITSFSISSIRNKKIADVIIIIIIAMQIFVQLHLGE